MHLLCTPSQLGTSKIIQDCAVVLCFRGVSPKDADGRHSIEQKFIFVARASLNPRSCVFAVWRSANVCSCAPACGNADSALCLRCFCPTRLHDCAGAEVCQPNSMKDGQLEPDYTGCCTRTCSPEAVPLPAQLCVAVRGLSRCGW